MTEALHLECSLSRQDELKKQILHAKSHNQQKELFLFESQWVHRYGIETLPTSLTSRLSVKTEESLGNIHSSKEVSQTKIVENINSNLIAENQFQDENDCLEKTDTFALATSNKNLIAFDSEEESNTEIDKEFDNSVNNQSLTLMPPPPPRTITSNLRRWLPKNEIDLPKAS